MTELARIATWIREADSVTVLTGAGISTESGIPDFRGPQGIWTKDPKAEKLSHINHYMSDPDVRRTAWRLRLEHPSWTASPNKGHKALAELEAKGKLQSLITQNIDGLHQMAGNSDEVTVEIHGTIREVMCMSCDDRAPMEKALDAREGRRRGSGMQIVRGNTQERNDLVRSESGARGP